MSAGSEKVKLNRTITATWAQQGSVSPGSAEGESGGAAFNLFYFQTYKEEQLLIYSSFTVEEDGPRRESETEECPAAARCSPPNSFFGGEMFFSG